jgi:hypothetical protein
VPVCSPQILCVILVRHLRSRTFWACGFTKPECNYCISYVVYPHFFIISVTSFVKISGITTHNIQLKTFLWSCFRFESHQIMRENFEGFLE